MQKSTTNFDEKFKVNDLQHEAAGMRGEPECLTLTSPSDEAQASELACGQKSCQVGTAPHVKTIGQHRLGTVGSNTRRPEESGITPKGVKEG